jgi:hypothetical protein
MPAQNYVLLERVVVGEAQASSITFSSIPQTGYTDLKIVASARSVRAGGPDDLILGRFNGSATGYTGKRLFGLGSGAGNTDSLGGTSFPSGAISTTGSTTSTFGNVELYIPNYTSSNYKSVSSDGVGENNATLAVQLFSAGLWANTSAITSVTLLDYYGGNFVQYSSFSLYGLAAVGTTPTVAPKASGGSIIQTDGTYWYHAFLASGTFTPAVGLSCDVLVVAGGGGGSNGYGAGGGAGGYRALTSQSISASAQTVTIGGGGAGATIAANPGTSGSNSSVGSIASTGGGGAGSYGTSNALSGGSGGGAGGGIRTGGSGNAGSYSPVEGYAGGSTTLSSTPSGGGGGAGAVGGNGTAGQSGAGGIGAFTAISGGSITGVGVLSGGNYYFAGGGGGGADSAQSVLRGLGGTGGGGAGGTAGVAGTAGTINTGAGAGGGGRTGGTTFNGGLGGSGIVVIRYAV